jgi:NAD(P)-dependent dehydrogenase (short-subunit alcohol dehydrogenase family)
MRANFRRRYTRTTLRGDAALRGSSFFISRRTYLLSVLLELDMSEAACGPAQCRRQAGARAVHVDVSKRDDVVRLIDDIVSEFRQLDYIFNNVAIVIGGDRRDLTIAQYDRVIDNRRHVLIVRN